jgi:acyl-CoA reductase-like NAD-dependent aldehyde dehydrogenase
MSGDGYFFEPSVVLENASGTRFSSEEIFGPVLTVRTFSTAEEAVELANDTRYGLSAGLFTNNLSRAHQMAAELDAGAVWVNGYPVPDLNLPFGGFKESGWGRENGEFGIEAFTELKSVTMALR